MKITNVVIVFAAILASCKGKMSFKDQCIYWHNYFRTLHQVNNVTWSMSLQKEAEDWVKYLAENNKFHHSKKNPGNLYLSNSYPAEYCSDAIQWFHWEEKDYNYDKPGYVEAAGHFTQVVWRNSREIGAAWAIRKDKRLVISIKYHPGGNYVGYFGRNVFRPIATTLGPEWPHSPPSFTRCPAKFVQTTLAPTTTPIPGPIPFKDQCLYWINYFRTLHQVPTVSWSLSLEKEAKDWVKYLADNNKFEQSSEDPGNLYLSRDDSYPEEFCSNAVWWFHSEEKFYNYSKPGYVRKAGNFTQLIWKNSTQIGAAWALRKDKRLVISIKYSPRGNNGSFARNIFQPTATTLSAEWGRVPPSFASCPADFVQTTPSMVPTSSNMTKPHVKAAARRVVSSLQLFIGTFIFVGLIL